MPAIRTTNAGQPLSALEAVVEEVPELEFGSMANPIVEDGKDHLRHYSWACAEPIIKQEFDQSMRRKSCATENAPQRCVGGWVRALAGCTGDNGLLMLF